MPSFSKTEVPCDCGWLSGVINDPESRIAFDPLNNQIIIDAAGASYVLYHCPFCGGMFPDRSKPMWVPIVPQSEFDRIKALSANLATAEQILERLGPADTDGWSRPGAEFRCIGYYHLSEFLNLEFILTKNGDMRCDIQIKPLSPRHQDVGEQLPN